MDLLINVSYVDNTNKFWQDSFVKNMVVFKKPQESIIQCMVRVMEETDFVKVSYKGKPQSKLYQDHLNEEDHIGYIFRVKSDINTDKGWKETLFDAWVTVKEVVTIDLSK